MNGFKQKVMSVVMVGVNAIAPLGQAIGFRAVTVGAAAVAAPAMGYAQTNHRLCGAVMEVTKDYFAGVMMEVNKGDFVTCGALITAATNKTPGTTTLRATFHKVMMDWYHGFPSEDKLVARLARCEDPTKWWFGGAYGGDVCNSMKDYRLYRFFHYKKGNRNSISS